MQEIMAKNNINNHWSDGYAFQLVYIPHYYTPQNIWLSSLLIITLFISLVIV